MNASLTRPLFEAAMRVLADERYAVEIKRFAVVPEPYAVTIYVLAHNGAFGGVTMDALLAGAREDALTIHWSLRGLLHRLSQPTAHRGELPPAARRVYENLTDPNYRDVAWGSWEKGDQA